MRESNDTFSYGSESKRFAHVSGSSIQSRIEWTMPATTEPNSYPPTLDGCLLDVADFEIVKVVATKAEHLAGEFFRKRWERSRCGDAPPGSPVERHVPGRGANHHAARFVIFQNHKFNRKLALFKSGRIHRRRHQGIPVLAHDLGDPRSEERRV